jgi:hypothetical protein
MLRSMRASCRARLSGGSRDHNQIQGIHPMSKTIAFVLVTVPFAFAVACASPPEHASPPNATTTEIAAPADLAQELRCEPSPRMPLEGRASPYDSATVMVGGEAMKVCYGRPAARGRTMLGGELVPYGELWRTGANEPTVVHLPFRARIAGIDVEPGSYSLYTIPGETQWTIILNRSTTQWGHESAYTDQVRAQEAGRATVPAEQTEDHVETFTIRAEPRSAQAADMILEWETTRVRVPVERV